MKKIGNEYKADEGYYFVLTRKGKQEHKTYKSSCKIGQPVGETKRDQIFAYKLDVECGYLEEAPIPGWGTFVGYKLLYNYKGYELSPGCPEILPTREIAEGYKRHYESAPWFGRDKELYIKEVEYQGRPLEPCREYNGKTVYNKDYCFWEAMSVGDYVDEEVADEIIDALPPACMRDDCRQMGEPESFIIDDESGKARCTYLTLKKVADGVWEYCGNCFIGENVERGKEIPYV